MGKGDPFGIDWEKVKNVRYLDPLIYDYEECLDLPEDPELAGEGVQICARVTKDHKEEHPPKNRILFKKRGVPVSEIHCVHTAICTLPIGETKLFSSPEKTMEFVESLEYVTKEVELPAEEHFKALRSYVAGIAEMGIANLFVASYEQGDPQSIPFGFNTAMQEQMLEAITKASPLGSMNIRVRAFEEVYDRAPRDWISSRFKILNKMLKISELSRGMDYKGLKEKVLDVLGDKWERIGKKDGMLWCIDEDEKPLSNYRYEHFYEYCEGLLEADWKMLEDLEGDADNSEEYKEKLERKYVNGCLIAMNKRLVEMKLVPKDFDIFNA